MRIGIYPGSFDPITNGHADIIRRAAVLVDKLIVGVASQSQKEALLDLSERVQWVERVVSEFPKKLVGKISVLPVEGLLIDFAHREGAEVIIRGLRAVSDFEYEFQMTAMNRRLRDNIDTVFLMASEDHHFVSSRFVKEIARLGGDVSSFVHGDIVKRLRREYKNK